MTFELCRSSSLSSFSGCIYRNSGVRPIVYGVTEYEEQGFPRGPGWWQANDGKWYPPELRPTTPPPLPAPAPFGPNRNAWQRFRANPLWLQVVAWAAASIFALGTIGAATGAGNNNDAPQ